MIKCALIRHAKTLSNSEGKYIGKRTDEDILPPDPKKAEAVADDVTKFLGPDHIVISGPSKRCRQTANLLFVDMKADIIDELSELDFGIFEGKTYQELSEDPIYRKWLELRGRMNIPGVEERDGFTLRSMEGFSKAVSRCRDGGGFAVICSSGNIMAIMSTLTGGDYYDFAVGNLEGYVLKIIDDERISVASYDRIGGGSSA